MHVSTLMLAFYSKHCCFKVAPMTMSAGNVVTLWVCVCVWRMSSWQNVALKISYIAGTNTEVVLILRQVYICLSVGVDSFLSASWHPNCARCSHETSQMCSLDQYLAEFENGSGLDKSTGNREQGSRKGAIGPPLNALAHICFKLRLTVKQFQSFPPTQA